MVYFVLKILEESSSCGISLGMVYDVKNREECPLPWGVRKNLNFRFLVLKVWKERIN